MHPVMGLFYPRDPPVGGFEGVVCMRRLCASLCNDHRAACVGTCEWWWVEILGDGEVGALQSTTKFPAEKPSDFPRDWVDFVRSTPSAAWWMSVWLCSVVCRSVGFAWNKRIRNYNRSTSQNLWCRCERSPPSRPGSVGDSSPGRNHSAWNGLIPRTLGPFNVFILLNGRICSRGVLD